MLCGFHTADDLEKEFRTNSKSLIGVALSQIHVNKVRSNGLCTVDAYRKTMKKADTIRITNGGMNIDYGSKGSIYKWRTQCSCKFQSVHYALSFPTKRLNRVYSQKTDISHNLLYRAHLLIKNTAFILIVYCYIILSNDFVRTIVYSHGVIIGLYTR